MDSFLKQTAKVIIEKLNWQQLSHATLVLPSHRAGLVLKNELLQLQKQQQQKAIWAPDVKTLQQLQDSLSPLYAEDELMTIVRLFKKYSAISDQDSEEPLTLDQFYTWGRQMIADFTNVDASMSASQVDNFFENTIAAHELSSWDLEPEVKERLKSLFKEESQEWREESLKAQYESLWRNIHTLYKALHAEMAAEQKGYPGMRQRAVIEQWDEPYIQHQIAGRMYVFVGFNYLLPVERELMLRLRDAGQALFFWDMVPNFETNTKAFFFAQENAKILGNSGEVLTSTPINSVSRKPREVTVVSCISKEAQAQYVHQWLKENYTAKGQKVGVVICDESMLESVIYAIPAITLDGEETPEPVNITKGFPLRHTAIFAKVLSWLYDRKRGDVNQVVSPDFIDQMIAEVLNENEGMSELGDDGVSDLSMKWQDLLILESEYQVRKVANQMKVLVSTGLGEVPFTLKLLRLLMRRVMEGVTMPFHGEPVTDMQVMGVLETRLLDFDRLLLLNVDEGVVPQTQADSSFIPYYLRKAYSMQTSDERATVYAYNFFRLLNRTGHSTILFTSTDAANSKGMSRFVMQMLVSPEFKVSKAQLKERSVIEPIDEARLNTSGTSLLDKLHVENGRVLGWDGELYQLSPSAINAYLTCPRKFCFTYIQGVRSPEQDEQIFGAATMGTFVHDAMHYLYTKYLECKSGVKKRVSPEDFDRLLQSDQIIEESLAHAYLNANKKWKKQHHTDEDHFLPEKHRPEHATMLTFIRNILERDKADAAVGLQLYLLEEERYFELDVPGAGVVQLGGRIDRADIFGVPGDERIRIIDYKSGKFDSNYMSNRDGVDTIMDKPEKGYIRQTLIYSHALMESEDNTMAIEPHLYFCSCPLPRFKSTLSFHQKPFTNYRPEAAHFIEKLSLKASEILTATEFPPCEEDKCPSYCPFFMTCGRKVKTER